MYSGFSFDKALGYAFKAPHARGFMIKYAIGYGLFGVIMSVAFVYLLKGPIVDIVNQIVAMDASGVDASEEVAWQLIRTLLGRIALPVAGLSLLSWVIWAMFYSASYRRYIREDNFGLKFDGDELRMIVISVLWTLLGLVIFAPLILIAFASGGFAMFSKFGTGEMPSDAEFAGLVLMILGLMFLAFPVFVFFATRLSPCFALTIKTREIRFFDAWNVTRKRFWPLFGAFVILAIGGGILASVVDQIFQFGLMSSLSLDDLSMIDDVDTIEEAMELLFSPANIAVFLVYIFFTSGINALVEHVCMAPAALAARHDPRDDDGFNQQIDVFN